MQVIHPENFSRVFGFQTAKLRRIYRRYKPHKTNLTTFISFFQNRSLFSFLHRIPFS